jgi:predicted kinase
MSGPPISRYRSCPLRPAERLYVLVSGPPASGKSTLAPPTAAYLGLPLIAKDTIKEALMSAAAPRDVEASRALGRAAIAVMYAVAADAPRGAVLENAFRRAAALVDLRALRGRLVEVHCRCARDVALERYRARGTARHAGHFDHERSPEELWNPEVVGPIGDGWPVLGVDTNRPVELASVLAELDSLLGT